MKQIKHLTCGYCSTGCCLNYDETNKRFPISANAFYPVNLGKACHKGFQMLSHLDSANRARTPLIRDAGGNLTQASWEKALNAFTTNFKKIQAKYGEASIAFISTGQITNEEHALLGALAKFGMGLIHGDGNTRQCMATAVVAYKQSFGWDAPPFTYKDFEESDTLVFIGSNPIVAHPVMWNRVKMNKNNPKILVVDPRNSETAQEATHHYPIVPGSELVFLYTVANILIQNGWIDQEYIEDHTKDFARFKDHVSKFTAGENSPAIGLPPAKTEEFARLVHEGDKVSFWWMVGINQSYQATRSAQAIINLALMTGNMGKPGTGANSITGQCNAMGARIFSNTTGLLGGYEFTDKRDRAHVAKILGIDEYRIPTVGSLAYDGILQGIETGDIKGLWVVCTNPAHSWIQNTRIPELFEKLEYLVVQDLYHDTETAQLADLILPAAGCGEKWGTFINSERRIGVLEPALDPPGEALSDFDIFLKIANAWGCGDLFKGWKTPHDAFMILKNLTRGKPWDFSGIRSYEHIKELGGIQWPFPEHSDSYLAQERRLFEDGKFYHEDGRAVFLFEKIQECPESPSEKFPFYLTTGRGTIQQWHTQTRTRNARVLFRAVSKEPYVEIAREDAARLGIQDDEWILVNTPRNTSKVRAKLSGNAIPGRIFMPMHYIETNRLTNPRFDEYSREPMYKYSIAQISKIT